MQTPSAELVADLRLAMAKGIGPRTHATLIAEFGSSAAALAAGDRALLAVERFGPKLLEQLRAAPTDDDVAVELRLAARHGIHVVSLRDERYPQALAEIPDPPQVFFYRGQLLPHDALAIAMVGTRHASTYGLQQAAQLAESLARSGVTVVSGLARGIDAAAHRGALAGGGRTLAVMAGGLLQITPPENIPLAEEIARQGCLLSEMPPRTPPGPGAFPRRNRLVSGLSMGVVVIEADDKSGALITARHAAEQGRDVFALPGNVTSRGSRGCHRLIQEGAKLITCAGDILEELTWPVAPVPRADGTQLHHVAELSLNDLERRVLESVASTPTSIDDIVVSTALPVHQVLSTISVLEMRHLLRRHSGNQVVRP
jgi:DNA processing protein